MTALVVATSQNIILSKWDEVVKKDRIIDDCARFEMVCHRSVLRGYEKPWTFGRTLINLLRCVFKKYLSSFLFPRPIDKARSSPRKSERCRGFSFSHSDDITSSCSPHKMRSPNMSSQYVKNANDSNHKQL